ncbi:MAG: HAD hydrolase family protein [Candidatus Woesearchaeota archaeon]
MEFTTELQKMLHKGKIVCIADKDGVLSPPHGNVQHIQEILQIVDAGHIFVIVSGANIDRARREILSQLFGQNLTLKQCSNMFLIMNNGASIYSFDKQKKDVTQIYHCSIQDHISEKTVEKVLDILKETREKFSEIKKLNNTLTGIQQINDEGTQIVFRILGHTNDDVLRKTFDPTMSKRKKWAKYIAQQFKKEKIDLSVNVAGTSSINILVPGISKASGIKHLSSFLKIPFEQMIYLGDSLAKEENDRAAGELVYMTVNFGKPMYDLKNIINSEIKGPEGSKTYLTKVIQTIENK